MRIYNGTAKQLSLPLTPKQRISVAPHSVSGDVLPSTQFLSLLVSSFDYDKIALIISGPFEINLCASVSGCVGFVVNSLDEAIQRFSPKVETEEEIKEEEGAACETEKTEEQVEKKSKKSPKKVEEPVAIVEPEIVEESPVEGFTVIEGEDNFIDTPTPTEE